MKTEILSINRTPVWVSFCYQLVEKIATGNLQDCIICYYKLEEPNNDNYGEILTNNKNEIVFFVDIKEARDGISHILKSKVYPPDFLHPLEYTVYNIEEIMNKLLIISIGEIDSEESTFDVTGIIFQCSYAGNPPYFPVAAKLRLLNNEKRIFNFFEMKKIYKG